MEERIIMNDRKIIYADDAIDAITNYGKFLWNNFHETCNLAGMIDAIETLPSAQPEVVKDINVPNNDIISRRAVRYKLTALVNEFEEILSHIREREVNDSVCGLCEYDGAYIGQSGDWCNECPGFDKDDCFKLNEKYRKEWTDIDE